MRRTAAIRPSLIDRVRACWPAKLWLAAGLSALLCGPYFLLGTCPVRPPRSLPLTWVDTAIGFHPAGWTWVYQSVYPTVDLIPLLATTRAQLRRYAAGFAATVLVSFAVFLAVPVRAPKPVVAHPSGMYALLQRYDVSLNAFPSLHVGLLVLTLQFGRRVVRPPVWVASVAVGWGLLIAYSTMATKEHYAADVVAGAVLGWAADRWAWRSPDRPEPGRVGPGPA